MIAWILILTIISSTGESVVERFNYQTEQGCQKAAIYWNKKLPKKIGANTYTHFAICVDLNTSQVL